MSAGSLGNRRASSSAGLPARRSYGRCVCAAAGHEPVEVREPPGDGDAEPGRRRRVVGVEPGEHALERRLRVLQLRPVARRARAVITSWCSGGTSTSTSFCVTTFDPLEQMLLGQLGRDRLRARRRRRGELVDELVDPERPERPGRRARDDLRLGLTNLRPR